MYSREPDFATSIEGVGGRSSGFFVHFVWERAMPRLLQELDLRPVDAKNPRDHRLTDTDSVVPAIPSLLIDVCVRLAMNRFDDAAVPRLMRTHSMDQIPIDGMRLG